MRPVRRLRGKELSVAKVEEQGNSSVELVVLGLCFSPVPVSCPVYSTSSGARQMNRRRPRHKRRSSRQTCFGRNFRRRHHHLYLWCPWSPTRSHFHQLRTNPHSLHQELWRSSCRNTRARLRRYHFSSSGGRSSCSSSSSRRSSLSRVSARNKYLLSSPTSRNQHLRHRRCRPARSSRAAREARCNRYP